MAGKSTFNAKLADAIIEAVTDGASLSEAAAGCGVPRLTVRSWLERKPEFRAAFDAACVVRTEVLFDRIVARASQAEQVAADAARNGLNPNAQVNAIKLECEQIRWALSKIAPATYGDKLTTELTGAGGKDLLPDPDPDISKLALVLLTILRP